MRVSALAFLWVFIAEAEIVDSSSHGFTVRDTINIAQLPLNVYEYIVKDVGKWWNSAHTWSGKSGNLSIDDRAGGCFCEKLEHGGSVRHMEVVFTAPGSTLRLVGGIGPLQAMAVTGTMTWTLSKSDKGTRVEVTYTVGGYHPRGLAFMAKPVDGVLLEQMTRLKSFIERGKPD
jgi:hypothetical protein